jgi:hypothetical protein
MLTQAILKYSFVDRPWLDLELGDQARDDLALIAQVHRLLVDAGNAFSQRHYSEAVNLYKQAESLIYAHLDPRWRPDAMGRHWFALPRDPVLFDALLSATTQWLNVLPVPGPVTPVRPPSPPDPQRLGAAAKFSAIGLRSATVTSVEATAAIADAHLAGIMTRAGNQAASEALLVRARGLDANVAAAIHAAAPVAAPMRIDAIERLRMHPVPLPPAMTAQRQMSALAGPLESATLQTFSWPMSGSIDINAVKSSLYVAHANATSLPDRLLLPNGLSEVSLALPHDYNYVIPLALAECYHALGDWPNAEANYLTAAGYGFINKAIEGPYIWTRLGQLYVDWGDSLYREDDAQNALPIYARILNPDDTAPSSQLWTLPGLSNAATIARGLLPQLPTLIANGPSAATPDVVAILHVVLEAKQRIGQIKAGLDFWGHWKPSVPIWTFSYLQQVAINFAQLAQSAEHDVIEYLDRADQATLTRAQIVNQVAQSNAEINAAMAQLQAVQAEVSAYQQGAALAQQRAADAATDAQQYAATNSHSILLSAVGQQVSGGDDGDWEQLSNLADQMIAGGTSRASRGTLAAAQQLAANRVSQQYQVDHMQRTAAEMQQAVGQAQAELAAANARATAAGIQVTIAQMRASEAAQTLQIFDDATFTPGVWRAMGNAMQHLYDRYMKMALRAARLMQKAYNFENDRSLSVIKTSYPGVIQGLLGADQLMADIQSFTDDMLTSTRSKMQPLKTTIRLAERYGYAFETQFRKTGAINFETTPDDFDMVYPGTYAGRIKRVQVALEGIVPPIGVSGTLTNAGISVFRLPNDAIVGAKATKQRIQSAETLVLSDYDSIVDGTLDSSGGRITGIFEGAGVASSWRLELPKSVNDINYGALTDVVLTFLYESRFDPALADKVKHELATRPGITSRQTALPLRWLYPDLFYGFVSSGGLTLALAAVDFRANERSPVVNAVSVIVKTKPPKAPTGLVISLATPGKAAVKGTADVNGVISSQSAGSPWSALGGGPAIGDWRITAAVVDNPGFTSQGALDLSLLINLVLVFDYTYTPRG